jgi:endonuclease YncB( thermonuclease family)
MARLVLAGGPAPRRRRPVRVRSDRRSSSRLPGRLNLPLGYALCALLALVGVLVGRTDLPGIPSEPWARTAPQAEAPDVQATPLGPVRVIDGDTLALGEERIRIANIDAPEMPPKAKCAFEAETALAAKARLRGLMAREDVTVRRTGQDRYGRTLAHVYVGGADAGETLIAAGLVRPWEGRRRPWCLQVAA